MWEIVLDINILLMEDNTTSTGQFISNSESVCVQTHCYLV